MTPSGRGRPPPRDEAIAALRECALSAEDSPGVALTDDWLSIARSIDAAGGRDRDAWSELVVHTARAGNAALVLCPRDETICLRADVPLDDGSDGNLTRRVHEACAAVQGDVSPVSRDDDRRQPPNDEVRRSLADHLDEIGWPALDRTDGSIAVELEVPGGYFQAAVAAAGAGVSFVATLVTTEELPSQPARTALAYLLLRAAGAVRLVRPFARVSVDGAAAGLEIAWSGVPTAAEVAHSLRALSVACALCGREAEALQRDDDLARRYLETRMVAVTRTTNRPAACAAG
jgi:hypothetical protein